MNKYTKMELPKSSFDYFERMNKGWKCTGEVLREEFTDRYGSDHMTEYVVLSGPFTRYGMCRDCGDHYIIARWSRFDKIDKETLEITLDVEDM